MANPNASQKRASIQGAVAQLTAEQSAEAVALPSPIPIPLFVPNSGLYSYSLLISIDPLPIHPPTIPTPIPVPTPGPGTTGASELEEGSAAFPILPIFPNEELRLDVDGSYPQMKASGQISGFKVAPAYWIADVKKTGANTYEGSIWYKDGNLAIIPSTNVKIEVVRTLFSPQ